MKKTKTIEFLALTVLMLWTVLSAAQLTENPARGYKPPRMADGHPDLNGTYDVATITPLVRLPIPGVQRALTDEQAAKAEAMIMKERKDGDVQLSPDRPAPPKGNGDQDIPVRYRIASGNVGGYNSFWIDPGWKINVVNGEKRSSIIVDPPDPMRAKAVIPDWIPRRAPTMIRNAVLRPSAACWDLVLPPGHQYSPYSMTTSIRSCRRPTPS